MNPSRHTLRVYYEDTDAGGVVYHAAYVCFFERARTEWLRQHGHTHAAIAELGVLFAVKSLAVQYRQSALLDDELTVETTARAAGRSRVLFQQQLRRGEEMLAEAEVEVVCVSPAPFRPIPLPPPLKALLAP